MSQRQSNSGGSSDKQAQSSTPQATAPAKGADAISQLQVLIDQLTPDQRERMQQAGVVVPEGDLRSIFSGKHKFALRCCQCNEIALVFVGTKFKWAGVDYDEPPPVHHTKVAWFQELEPGQIDRHRPKCQKCFHLIPLLKHGAFDLGRRRLVTLETWEGSRDVRFSHSVAKKLAAEVTENVSAEGGGDPVDNNYNLPDQKASSIIDQQHGAGTAAMLDATMKETGITEMLATGVLK